MLTAAQIKEILAQVREPNLAADVVSAGIVKDIAFATGGEQVSICLSFPYPAKSAFARITAQATPLLQQAGVANPQWTMSQEIHPRTVQGGVARLPAVKNIIAVASAKGGVGKSTTTANLALALQAEGAQVGILDTDIYGPSLPVMLGVRDRPQPAGAEGEDGKQGLMPLVAYGMQLMSMGFVVAEEQAVVWRAPMVVRALLQFLRDTRWDGLDYLLLDMPPGTGDVQLTIAQQVPVTGAIIITTPQDLAVSDARRGLTMFEKVSIPVLGVVENMSWYRCPNCQNDDAIFGSGGAEKLCAEHHVELLGALPLERGIRDAADSGRPTVAAVPESDTAGIYRRIATRAAAKVAQKTRDRSDAFPQIVISD